MALLNIPDSIANLPLIRNLRLKMPTAASLTKGDLVLINRLAAESVDRSRKGIAQWRSAMDQADDPVNPNWQPLQDLIEYVEPDAQLGTSIEIRVASTLSKRFIIYDKKTGEEITEKTQILQDKNWFFLFLWHMLDTMFKKYTVAQLVDPVKMQFSYLPRRNFVPQRKFFKFSVTGELGYKLDDPAIVDTIIIAESKHKYGILNDIIPDLIWKKNAKQSWHEFGEKFGIPLISATTNKRDKKEIAAIEAMLRAMGEAMTAVLPENTTITIHDSVAKGDPYKVYLEQIKLYDEYIAKRLLGGTMVIEQGSSRAQGEVHERTLKDVISLFDKMLIMAIVNDQLLPMMAKFGYPFSENDGFKFDETKEIPIGELSDILDKLLNHYDVDEKWVTKTFNIPILGKKKTVSADTNFNTATTAMAAALVAHGITLPNYAARCGHVHNSSYSNVPRADFSANLLDELSTVLINEVFNNKPTLATELLKSIQSYSMLRDGLFDSYSNRIDLSYDTVDHRCLQMMEYNLFEFSRLKEKSNVFALNQLLIDSATQNRRSEKEFQQKAIKYLKNPDVNWLSTEYNHTIAVGQNASRYHQFIRESDQFQYVEWQTVGDGRVRAAHAAMDGKLFNLKANGGITAWPPSDWGCRCEFIQHTGKPDANKIVSNAEMLKLLNIEQGSKWDVNRAEIAKVFTANEMYVKEKGLLDDQGKLSFKAYGKKPWKEIKEQYKPLKLDESITEDNISELFKPEKNTDYMGFKDYLKRKLVIDKKVFDYHTKKRYTTKEENRHQLFPHIKEVLASPDEVYFTQYGTGNNIRFQSNYIKFYNNESIVVNVEPSNHRIKINSWFYLKVSEDQKRKGYLIYQNKKS
ncbi:MAG: DUF935 family protein [Sphingobacteriia bacterium]|nr:MAG: DUF935 family protein [Sphingobacteriia bacterium]